MIDYRKLAHKVFEPQLIVDIDDTDRVIEVCKNLVMEAGYPLLEDDGESEGWIEFVYEAQDMWEIAKEGFVYRAVRNPAKDTATARGFDWTLFTRENHPAFDY
jgi:hypothetical protein